MPLSHNVVEHSPSLISPKDPSKTGYLPTSYKKAQKCKDSDKWIEAIKKEDEGFFDKHAIEYVPLKSLSKKQRKEMLRQFRLFKIKASGRYKVRNVIDGSQQDGLYWYDTFAAVARSDSIRLIIRISAYYGLTLYGIDFSHAYLSAMLPKDTIIHAWPCEGFGRDIGKPCPTGHVLRLKSYVYGLKTSAKGFGEKVTAALTKIGFTRSMNEPCLYYGRFMNVEMMILTYVDDLIVSTRSEQAFTGLVNALREAGFALTTESKPDCYVGFQLEYLKNGTIELHCDRYTNAVIKRFEKTKFLSEIPNNISIDGMLGVRPMPFSAYVSENQLVEAKTDKVNPEIQEEYRSIVGSLLYMTSIHRIDIAYAVHRLSRFLTSCTELHLLQAYHVVGYLKRTAKLSPRLVYKAGTTDTNGKFIIPDLITYADSGYLSDEYCKSATGIVTMLGEAPIMWRSSLQSVNALSTCEAEFISLAEGAKSTIFPMQLLLEMNVDTRPFTLKEDNEACIKLVRQNVDFKRSKHILNRFYYLRHIAATMAKVQHVRSEEQLADILTKSTFTKSYFDEMARKLLKYTD